MSNRSDHLTETCARIIEQTVAWEQSFSSDVLRDMKSRAWPNASDEEWRRSDPSFINFEEYRLCEPNPNIVIDHKEPESYASVLSWSGSTLVLSSQKEALAAGLSIQLSRQLPDAVFAESDMQSLLQHSRTQADNRIALWNMALMHPHIVVMIPPHTKLSQPLLFKICQESDGSLFSPVFTVLVGEGADVTVLHMLEGGKEGASLYNEGINVSVGANARLRFFSYHQSNLDWNIFGNYFLRLHRDARLEHSLAVFGGLYAKYRVHVELAGQGAEANLFGTCFPHEDQHIDMRTVQRHLHSHTYSRTLYRSAASDEAHTIYQGLIRVEEQADETDAYLTNNNLLLSDAAQADSIPCLEIHTNELRCSHGSTTGKLNEEQVFYLCTRGYSRHEATKLLVEAHFEELISRYPDESAKSIRNVLRERIAG